MAVDNIIDCLLDRHLFHVVEDIFLHLDSNELFNAEAASRPWSRFIQSNRKLYHKKLQTISRWLLINVAEHKTALGRGLRSLGTIPYDERDQWSIPAPAQKKKEKAKLKCIRPPQ